MLKLSTLELFMFHKGCAADNQSVHNSGNWKMCTEALCGLSRGQNDNCVQKLLA